MPTPSRIGRSIVALLAGFVFTAVLHTVTDLVMHAMGVFPPQRQPMSDALFGLAFAYRLIISIGGCYLTARLAPHHPMRHALIGGAIGLVLSVVGAIVTWNKGPEFGPHWYPILLAVTAVPIAWLGGKLHERLSAK
jgi:hypothetical protein